MSEYPPFSPLATIYATDENIAIRAAGDFAVLCPEWQSLAAGTDGVFVSGDLFTLTSAGAGFIAAGIKPQHVIVLQKPISTFRGGSSLMAVDVINSGTSITLRRLGQASGAGAAPSPAGGLTGVQYQILTLDPQIEEESFDLNRRFGIDPTKPGRTPSEVGDLRDLRRACVLGVLHKRYLAEMRDSRGDFAAKARMIGQELETAYARLTLRWLTSDYGTGSNQFVVSRIER